MEQTDTQDLFSEFITSAFFFPLLICQPKEFLEILSEKREHEKEVRRGQTGRKQLSEGT